MCHCFLFCFFIRLKNYLLKSEAEDIIPKIRGPLDVNTKILLFRYMLFFSTKNGLFTLYIYCIGEQLVKYFAQKTMIHSIYTLDSRCKEE